MKQTRDEKLSKKRDWYHKNIDKVKESSKKSRLKHKEKRNLENKIWIENNKERYKEYQKEYQKKWYQKNKLKKNQKQKMWVKNNPDKVLKIKDNFKQNNQESIKKYSSDYIKTEKGKYRTLKGSAIKRDYDVSISFDEFKEIISKPCAYCGEKDKRIGIDRINNDIGYILENCNPCCKYCNMMKKDMILDEFIEHIQKIYKHTLLD